MEVRTLAVGAFQANAWLAWDPGSGAGFLIDPGDEAERILAWIESFSVDVRLIVATHGHLDHVAAGREVREALGVPFALHPDDAPLLAALAETRALYGLPPAIPPRIDRELSHGATLAAGGLALEVRHCPGHSPGGVILAGPERAFTGDVIFQGASGRTDLPGGNTERLLRSISEQVLTLPDATLLHSGHGADTTVGAERRRNPFLRGL